MYRYTSTNIAKSTLYLVPTPIGNIEDITKRALYVMKNVDLIAAEDTRRIGILLKYFSINTKLCSFYNFNEKSKTNILLKKLKDGNSIALVSDAGTPIINDPGYYLVFCCLKININVVPLPGPCAAVTALSASGLPSNRFCYEGFLPSKYKARINHLYILLKEPRTLIFYESSHRLLETLENMKVIWGSSRHIVLAKELTKTWETIYGNSLENLIIWLKKDKRRQRGEITLIVEGYRKLNETLSTEVIRTFKLLLMELPIKKASALTSKIHGVKKNILYNYALLNRKIKM